MNLKICNESMFQFPHTWRVVLQVYKKVAVSLLEF